MAHQLFRWTRDSGVSEVSIAVVFLSSLTAYLINMDMLYSIYCFHLVVRQSIGLRMEK